MSPIGRFLAAPAPDDDDLKEKTPAPDVGAAYRLASKYSDSATTRNLASTETDPTYRKTMNSLADAEDKRTPGDKGAWRADYKPPMTVGKRLARLRKEK